MSIDICFYVHNTISHVDNTHTRLFLILDKFISNYTSEMQLILYRCVSYQKILFTSLCMTILI